MTPATDAAVRALLRDLAPLQRLDDARRSAGSVAPDMGGRGTPDPDGRMVAQVDSGALASARVSCSRMALIVADAREALGWCVEVAHAAPSAHELALHLATRHAPVALREAALTATTRAAESRTRADHATQQATCLARAHGPLSPVAAQGYAARTLATTTRDSHAAAEAQAVAALAAWGHDRLALALRAWEAATL